MNFFATPALAYLEQRAGRVSGVQREEQKLIGPGSQHPLHQIRGTIVQQRKKSGARLLPRLRIQIAQREFVVAVEHHHRDVDGGISCPIRIRFEPRDVQYGVAQGGEGISNFSAMLLAFAN